MSHVQYIGKISLKIEVGYYRIEYAISTMILIYTSIFLLTNQLFAIVMIFTHDILLHFTTANILMQY